MTRKMGAWWAALALLAASGCGRPTGAVSGRVTYNGAPLTSGSVTYLTEGNEARSCAIEPDGRYALRGIPAGPCRIAVTSLMPPVGMWNPQTGQSSGGGSGPAAYVPIPPRYGDAGQSGLTYEVKAGQQEHDIEMKP